MPPFVGSFRAREAHEGDGILLESGEINLRQSFSVLDGGFAEYERHVGR
jgi:hypothetical protein